MLWFMREALKGLLTWWLPVGALILLSGHYLRAKGALPAVAAYALIAPFVMGAMSWWFNRERPSANALPA